MLKSHWPNKTQLYSIKLWIYLVLNTAELIWVNVNMQQNILYTVGLIVISHLNAGMLLVISSKA